MDPSAVQFIYVRLSGGLISFEGNGRDCSRLVFISVDVVLFSLHYLGEKYQMAVHSIQ